MLSGKILKLIKDPGGDLTPFEKRLVELLTPHHKELEKLDDLQALPDRALAVQFLREILQACALGTLTAVVVKDKTDGSFVYALATDIQGQNARLIGTLLREPNPHKYFEDVTPLEFKMLEGEGALNQ